MYRMEVTASHSGDPSSDWHTRFHVVNTNRDQRTDVGDCPEIDGVARPSGVSAGPDGWVAVSVVQARGIDDRAALLDRVVTVRR
jgi:hypothetical protein